ncbi:hypothetical protein CDL12_20060 [Handroanthus impetiginosus]|uniref:FAF domain-containing protein n=1 Tax=Handroanthus impetiginosus TaxID=429701 RepID=A0A2G9GQ09_9LAMI|nr:hypothetical protein CDL12_20060 [Handroanthus impetiginosus]
MHNAELDDYIGEESCINFKPDVPELIPSNDSANTVTHSSRRLRRRGESPEKEYPPSIPLLARTGNLMPHMPWVMRKYSTNDGRLVIKEEKVRRHEYFEAHRSNGRLVLNLIPLDDAVKESCKEHWVEGEENVEATGEEIDGGDEEIGDPTVEEVGTKCIVYNGVGVNPCGGFGVAVAAFRSPVHTT